MNFKKITSNIKDQIKKAQKAKEIKGGKVKSDDEKQGE